MKIKIIKKSALVLLLVLTVTIFCGCGSSEPALPKANGTFNAVTVTDNSVKAIDALIEAYHDKYAVYYDKADYNSLIESIEGSYTGIGVYIYENEDNGRVTVLSAMKGGPAYAAGILPGDEILKVNGEDVSTQTTEYISAKFKAAAVGTEFELLINRQGSGQLKFKVKVDDVEYPTVDYKMLEGYDGIGLIKIGSFNLLTGDQFEAAFKDLKAKGMKGLILDVRDNGGGEITSALKVADMFTQKGVNLMYMVTSEGTYSYYGEEDANQIPLLILQNGNTASASEILIGALQDNNVGTTLGTLSYGKGIVQNIIPLDSGAGLRFTSSRYLTAGGHEVHKIGITPDIEYDQPAGTSVYASFLMDPAKDPQLAKGISVLQAEMK